MSATVVTTTNPTSAEHELHGEGHGFLDHKALPGPVNYGIGC